MTVVFNISNYTKCLCPVCPTQAESSCLADKDDSWKAKRRQVGAVLMEYPQHPETYEMDAAELENHEAASKHGFSKPDRDDMRELYCAIGRAACGDLGNKICVCPDCAVWRGSGLIDKYYCFK